MSTHSVRHLFPQLLSNGYVPIPNRDKVCLLPKWSTILVDAQQAQRWTRQMRWPAIGLRVEAPLTVFDLDLPREDIAKAVRDITPAAALAGLERHGNHPKTAFYLRLRAEPHERFHALRTHRYAFADEPKRTFAVEVFGGGGGGHQVGSFGPHSHDEHGRVLKRYSWVNDRSPANVPIWDLPELTRAEVADFIDAVDDLLAAWPGLIKDLQSRKGEEVFEEAELNHDMVFTDSEGSEYTLCELIDEAKARKELRQAELRLDGSFTGDAPGNPTRCKVHWNERTGLSVIDFKNSRIWRHKEMDELAINKMLSDLIKKKVR